MMSNASPLQEKVLSRVFRAAAIYNVFWGVTVTLFANLFFKIFGLPPINHPFVMSGLGMWIEIVVTLTDFIEEDRTRRLPAGERVMHALMGIVYGVFLALLYPQAARWRALGSGFGSANYGIVSWVLTVFAAGVFLSGLRDLAAGRKLAR